MTTLTAGPEGLNHQRFSCVQTSWLLTALLMLVLPAVVRAQFTFTTNNGAITITGYTGPGGAVTIPSTTNGLSVTSIGVRAFYNCKSLDIVTIPDSITSIEYAAFDNCTSLTNVTIPNSVTSIGGAAFESCTNLTKVTLPNSLTAIADAVFYGCISLTSVTIPSSVTRIGNNAFSYCTSLTSITISNTVTSIGFLAFGGCTNLVAITVDPLNFVYSSMDGVLFNKSQTTLISYPGGKAGTYSIPSSVTNIEDYAFSYCPNLTSVTLSNGVASVGRDAFFFSSNLSAIKVDALNPVFSSLDGVLFNKSQTTLIRCPECKTGNYTIPNSVTNVGDYAFDHCTGLTSVTISNGVTSIGWNAFSLCFSLSVITVDAFNSAFSSVDGVLFDKNQTMLIRYPEAKVGSYTVPSSVTRIGDNAFSYCTSLTNVTIPNSVTSIGSWAFASCFGLTSVTIPSGVATIESFTFQSCTRLTTISIGDSVNTISSYAFPGCTNLFGVYFGGNAPFVGSLAFSGDNNATIYYLPRTTGWSSTFGERPTVLWNPQFQVSDGSFGVQNNRFGFNITGTANIPIVLEASSNLAGPLWQPLQSCTLTNGSIYFSDADWANYPSRFYRIRSP